MPFWVPRDDPQAAEMACLKQNQPIGERFGDGTLLTYPNVFSSAWREFALGAGKALADKGCRHFTQDDPALNVELGTRGGCRSVGARLRGPAEERNDTLKYHRWLQAELRTYVAKIDPTTRPTFSANITNRGMSTRAWLLGEFDNLTSEIYARYRREEVLTGCIISAKPAPGSFCSVPYPLDGVRQAVARIIATPRLHSRFRVSQWHAPGA